MRRSRRPDPDQLTLCLEPEAQPATRSPSEPEAPQRPSAAAVGDPDAGPASPAEEPASDTEEAPPRDCVLLTARDAGGALLLREAIAPAEWDDRAHPLLDDPDERLRLGITRIDAVLYDSAGRVRHRWQYAVDARGAIRR
jgi:hypothetical protein